MGDPLIEHLDFQIVEARKALEWLRREGGLGPRARRRIDLVLGALDVHSAGSALSGRQWRLGDKLEVD